MVVMQIKIMVFVLQVVQVKMPVVFVNQNILELVVKHPQLVMLLIVIFVVGIHLEQLLLDLLQSEFLLSLLGLFTIISKERED